MSCYMIVQLRIIYDFYILDFKSQPLEKCLKMVSYFQRYSQYLAEIVPQMMTSLQYIIYVLVAIANMWLDSISFQCGRHDLSAQH